MATRMIYTGKGYVRLSDVEQVTTQKGKFQLWANDRMIDDNAVEFDTTIVSVIPVQGEWENLVYCAPDPEQGHPDEEILPDPVLAWGLTVMGHLIPITASERDGVKGESALRKVGSPHVYGSGSGLSGWKSVEAWAAYERDTLSKKKRA